MQKEMGFTNSFNICKGPTKWEILLVTKEEIHPQNYYLTAYNLLSKYGVNPDKNKNNYYTNIKPKIENVIIHILTLSVGNIPQKWLDVRA